ncbi:hypothetical protein L6452_01711 [Arctium lappa]|uniref:Uncharacterized protein n=1 Tax=Arctium lappa TaxID=4217 RepID=A0ACB9FGW1_ARCLA|nr:hypothetical protein L6452_01711 [Arctium lappa]
MADNKESHTQPIPSCSCFWPVTHHRRTTAEERRNHGGTFTNDLNHPPQSTDPLEEGSIIGLEVKGDVSNHGESNLQILDTTEVVVAVLDLEQQQAEEGLRRMQEEFQQKILAIQKKKEEAIRRENPIKRAMKAKGMVTRSATGTMQKVVAFTTIVAAGHYELLANQTLNMEKGFDPEFMNANPFIKDRVKDHDWVGLVAAKRKANYSFVKEFYAEAAGRKRDRVKVRGHWVQYDSVTINRVLGLKTPDSCAFSTLMQGTTEDDEDEITKALVVEEKTWELDGRRKVPTVPGDIWLTSTTTISDLTVKKMKRAPSLQIGEASVVATVGIGPSQIDPQSASIPTQTADTLVMLLAEFQKMNSILTSIEDRMRESERSIEFVWSYMRDRDEVHQKYLASKEPLLAQELPLFPPGICPTASSPEDDPFSTLTNASEGL